jgi:hypothetical protein
VLLARAILEAMPAPIEMDVSLMIIYIFAVNASMKATTAFVHFVKCLFALIATSRETAILALITKTAKDAIFFNAVIKTAYIKEVI